LGLLESISKGEEQILNYMDLTKEWSFLKHSIFDKPCFGRWGIVILISRSFDIYWHWRVLHFICSGL